VGEPSLVRFLDRLLSFSRPESTSRTAVSTNSKAFLGPGRSTQSRVERPADKCPVGVLLRSEALEYAIDIVRVVAAKLPTELPVSDHRRHLVAGVHRGGNTVEEAIQFAGVVPPQFLAELHSPDLVAGHWLERWSDER
jgi:hypothetical protein